MQLLASVDMSSRSATTSSPGEQSATSIGPSDDPLRQLCNRTKHYVVCIFAHLLALTLDMYGGTSLTRCWNAVLRYGRRRVYWSWSWSSHVMCSAATYVAAVSRKDRVSCSHALDADARPFIVNALSSKLLDASAVAVSWKILSKNQASKGTRKEKLAFAAFSAATTREVLEIRNHIFGVCLVMMLSLLVFLQRQWCVSLFSAVFREVIWIE